MKKTLLILGGLSFFALVPHVFAGEVNNGFVALTNIPGLTDGVANTTGGLANFLNNLYKYLIGVAAILAVVEIIWGGLEISTQDSVSKHHDGKERITQAILGLVLVLSPALVFSIINPNIINLSLNLPPLEIQTVDNRNVTGGTVVPPTTGCRLIRSGPYLESAVCASQSAATSYSCTNGLTLEIPSCRTEDTNGNCVDRSVTVYCAGRETTLTVYQYYGITRLLSGRASPIPRDAGAWSTFSSGCENDGGVPETELTAAALAFTSLPPPLAPYLVNNGCSSDSGVTVDTHEHSGVACYGNVLSCNPPK
jgi:type IV secretory pathway VirB2 component (pilin)